MSGGYFVHGGTQYPFGQNSSQQSSSGNQSYYGNTSYSGSQNLGQSPQQYSGYSGNSSSGGGSFSSNYSSHGSGFGTSGSDNGGFGGSSSYQGPLSDNYHTPIGSKSGNYGYNAGSGNNSSFASTQSSYEKALFTAANQYYSTNRGRGGAANRGGRGSFGRGRGRGGRGGMQSTQQGSITKPIKATEIKAYLYAWCGQRKLKPEYEITTEGQPPKKVSFGCKLLITGLDYVAQVEASNKKDAQSKAAWDFCENLVKTGYMKASELPLKPADPVPKTSTGETTQPVGSLPPETTETIDKYGGWTLTNARQRLNQFCQREHSTPIFKHETLGPEHARIFVCDLTLSINALQKEFLASERGSNKKQATAICALSMTRQLYEANLIEKFGDPIKHVTRGGLLGGKAKTAESETMAEGEKPAPTVMITPGQKRKAEEQQPSPDAVDEHGNWTVDNSRQRLNQFCQTHNIPCDVMYEEEGIPGNRTYTASLKLNVKTDCDEDKQLTASSKAQSKRVAAQGCALQLLTQLYKLSLVEASSNGGQPNKKKQSRQRDFGTNLHSQGDPGFAFGSVGVFGAPSFGRPHVMRKTPVQDIHLHEKHKSIYPTEKELDVVQRSVRTVELALKEVSDLMAEETADPNQAKLTEVKVEVGTEETSESEQVKKRKLQGVMRVGTLAKGLLLRGDLSVQLVLLCQDAPTAKLLIKVAQLLPKQMKPTDGDTYNVETAMQNAAIIVTNTTVKAENETSLNCTITISLTSPIVRSPNEEASKDQPGSLNKEKCLQALAELRHSKWFQACANGIPSCVIVIRILREMTRRLREWKPLGDWAVELLVEKSLSTSPLPLSLGSSFLRVLEVVASGILLPNGAGLSDPCERIETDATGNMTNQEREEITCAAQTALRTFIYRKPHVILGIDPVVRNDWYQRKHSTSGIKPLADSLPKLMETN